MARIPNAKKGCIGVGPSEFQKVGCGGGNVRELRMIDLSEIGEPITAVPKHLRNEHVTYWLLFREWGVFDALDCAQKVLEREGWAPEFHDEYEYFFRKDTHSIFLHVDTDPEGRITTRCSSGEIYEGPKWPAEYKGKLILEVWRV
ncbi:MAG: hypothetical protein R6V12_13240 [Candidatus Hydrogenedentota bacterium]